ncbi:MULTISPECIES: DUF3304 domain-containing protein [Variovorax]|uniref:DUF3304 domain-containing protein n=1 Tax=Variovorax paradoxus TaxID=34073 RepID=A0A5Q0LZT9_VARPD|nr:MULTISPECIES: DUF3304 domain-containing protein [Variovorax]QFZ82773.1 DUF3304 domain-containing protein [Variovorax paradoxus]WPG37523.1 DUF3304 domain-containing protein [Variovorax boronicumulans]
MKLFALLVLCALALLGACSSKKPAAKSHSANLSAYNHTEDYIHQFYVDGAGGGNSRPYGGGGSFVCCISYPAQWHPGLSATVKWTTSSGNPADTKPEAALEQWHERVIPIDKYDVPGSTLNVHFLTDGDVRLVISSKGSGAKDYPGPDYPVKPPSWKW